MWVSYLIACVPMCIGIVIWYNNPKITIFECIGGALAGFFTAFCFNYFATLGMTTDYETWSGQITRATFYPEWVEQYQVTIYRTVRDSKGNTHQEFDHYETRYRTHDQHWDCNDSIGCTHNIDYVCYNEICKRFNDRESEDGNKSGFYSGDPLIYFSLNRTGYVYPTTDQRAFENRIIASPNLFSYSEVPESVKVFPYPKNDNWMLSDRMIGNSDIDRLEWDRMNARLGSSKKVNVIIINFGDQDSEIAHQQEAKWIGGKKNDLVLCYGKGWAYVFGWTESDLVKRNLETILLGKFDIPKIEKEIRANYVLKDWSKFNYLSVSPPAWSYLVLIVVMILTQGGLWYWFQVNEFDKSAAEKDFFR